MLCYDIYSYHDQCYDMIYCYHDQCYGGRCIVIMINVML